MTRSRLIVATLLSMLLASAALAAPKVRVVHDEEVDFSKYRTYAWVEGEPAMMPELRKTLVEGVERELGYAGLSKVGENSADLLVSLHVVVATEGITQSAYNKMMRFDVAWQTVDARMYAKGVVILDLVDAEANKAVWEATVKAATNEYNYHRSRKRIEKAVVKMFEGFPPR
jgi:hypothetical protein